ncbi:MAG: lysine transporter LysE [Candidatus Methanogaster sp.]|uniref:Lysine transporter LysE n=1 Tax=Candidatus Methanogaster sp. TaxID=3386292 RepID=A0AC61KZD1_9EURY|nr:MAG: lysine transporter LysE [ANME-2 cluster archaeon]
MSSTLIEFLAFGFLIGLTGATVPGPMLFATIDASLRRGWIAGPEIVLGHAFSEVAVCALIVLGFTIATDAVFRIVSIAGGGALVVFGVMTLNSSKDATFDVDGSGAGGAVAAGVLTSVSNPYFLIWWLTIGNAMVMDGLAIGVAAAVLFVIGHWIADLAWYTFVSVSSSRGRRVMSDRTYKRMLVGCGVFLVCFGMYYLAGVFV